MPGVRTRRRTRTQVRNRTKRTHVTKRKRKHAAPITMLSLTTGFPNKVLVKHRYCQNVGLTSTTGTFASTQFRANGMFQPPNSGGGHQPMYFDQMTAIYDHFVVIASKCKIIVTPDSSSAMTKPAVVGLYVNDDTSVQYTSTTGVQEYQKGKTKLLNFNATKPITLTEYWSAKKYFGKNPLSNDNLQGSSSADPSEMSYYTICLQDVTTAATCTVDMLVEIEYIAIWKELKDISQS